MDPNDRLTKEHIVPKLKTKLIGTMYQYVPSVDSTNDRAKKWIRHMGSSVDEGLVVVAEEQTAGKGRRGRTWASPYATGIWTSIVLRPKAVLTDIPQIPFLAALAVIFAIEDVISLKAQLKWPNDVLLAGKKVSGILVETDGDFDEMPYVIVGIGINANVPSRYFPDGAHAISLHDLTGKSVDRAQLLAAVLLRLEGLYIEWLQRGFGSIRAQVLPLCVSIGRPVRVVESKSEWEGEGVDIGEDGALLVRRRTDGMIVPVYAGDVSLAYNESF